MFDTADQILNNCYNDLVSKTTKTHNSEKIVIYNTRAELKLVRKDIKGSLEDLKLCYRLAQAKGLSQIKIGELLMNMTSTTELLNQKKEALNYSNMAVSAFKSYVPYDEKDMINQIDLLI